MKRRQDVDPLLHILKSYTLTLQGPERGQVDSARFNLYVAFESEDAEKARQWARALRGALLVAPESEQRGLALDAVGEIEQAIEVPS